MTRRISRWSEGIPRSPTACRPIAVGAMLGEITGSRILDKSTIRAGDELL